MEQRNYYNASMTNLYRFTECKHLKFEISSKRLCNWMERVGPPYWTLPLTLSSILVANRNASQAIS